MIMRELWDTLNDFVYFNFRWIIISAIILINLIGFFVTHKNFEHTLLFYPDTQKKQLIAEKRQVIKSTTKIGWIKNTIDELLLGPMQLDYENIYSKNAKLLSARLDGQTLYLNFNRETVMDIEWKYVKNVSIYYLFLQSIVDSVCFRFNNITKVMFSFDGKEYRYLGDYGPIDNGLSPDWTLLQK